MNPWLSPMPARRCSGCAVALLLAACGQTSLVARGPDSNRPSPDAAEPVREAGLAEADASQGAFPPWLWVEGVEFVAGTNKTRLAGVSLTNNAWGEWVSGVSDALSAQGRDPLIRPTEEPAWALTDRDFELLATLGINCVRYDFAYEEFAADNPKRSANLSQLRAHAQRFGQLGIYVIFDMMMPPGLDVQSDNYERAKPGAQREQSIFEDRNLLDSAIDVWNAIAGTLKDISAVAGYEIVNEPRVPSAAEGGQEAFRAGLQALYDAIRAVDVRHVVFVPEFNSREANPGESYWDDQQKAMVDDAGEQGILWDRGFVPIHGDNIAYVFHSYDPYSYTHEGAASFDPAEVVTAVQQRVKARDAALHAPLILTEYGANRKQTAEKRAAWLQQVHALLGANHISSTYFTYKSTVDPWVPPESTFGLYGQFVTHDSYVTIVNGSEELVDSVVPDAKKNGFDVLFANYFRGRPASELSLLDNAPVLAELKTSFAN